MTDATTNTPNASDFSRDDKPRKYTARIEVRGTISISIEADNLADAERLAKVELDHIEKDGYVEIDFIDEMDLQRVRKDAPMYRVTREGEKMQVSQLKPGDLPRDPDPDYGF